MLKSSLFVNGNDVVFCKNIETFDNDDVARAVVERGVGSISKDKS